MSKAFVIGWRDKSYEGFGNALSRSCGVKKRTLCEGAGKNEGVLNPISIGMSVKGRYIA